MKSHKHMLLPALALVLLFFILMGCSGKKSITFVIPKETALRGESIHVSQKESFQDYMSELSKHMKPDYAIIDVFSDELLTKKVTGMTELHQCSKIYVKTIAVEGLEKDFIQLLSNAMFNLENYEMIGDIGYKNPYIVSVQNGKTSVYSRGQRNEQSWGYPDQNITYYLRDGIQTSMAVGSQPNLTMEILATQIYSIVRNMKNSVMFVDGVYLINYYNHQFTIQFENDKITEFVMPSGFYTPGKYVLNYKESQIPQRPDGIYHKTYFVEYYGQWNDSRIAFDSIAILDYEELLMHSLNVMGVHYLDYFTKDDVYYDKDKKHKVDFDENGKHILKDAYADGSNMNLYIDFKSAYKGEEEVTKQVQNALLTTKQTLGESFIVVDKSEFEEIYWKFDAAGNPVIGYSKSMFNVEGWYVLEKGHWNLLYKYSDDTLYRATASPEKIPVSFTKHVQTSIDDLGFYQISESEFLGFGHYYGRVFVRLKNGLIEHVSTAKTSVDIFYDEDDFIIPPPPVF